MNIPDKTIFPFPKQKRRDFLKTLTFGTGGILLSPAISSCNSEYNSELYLNFLEPSAEAKPFFRWWWNGNRISKEELSRELELMHEAGIGGVEINPIVMPEQAETLIGKEYIWLSDDWIELLEFTIEKAKSLGMITDLIVGTGWPFGGEFLKPEETIQGLKVETIAISGPGVKTIKLPSDGDSTNFTVKEVVLFPSYIKGLQDAISIPFNKDDKEIKVKVPGGKHILYMITWQNNFRQVMHGAPGGAGPVLDHFNQNAVENYLNFMSDKIKAKTGKPNLEGIRAMFCDSIELAGANWTWDFDKIFSERRGYDLTPYLPLLLVKEPNIDDAFEDELMRARFDYSQTLAELLLECFIVPFHNWCKENGTKSRYQAYGHPWLYTDLVDGNMVPDIPEGDQWLFNGSWQPYADVDEIRYAIWNKYASSAGHLANRNIISTEAMTNTSGVFKASLKYIKQATDLNLTTGINHQVLHGFNYSPPEAGFPGWIRYGCYFNEQNPWWQYMPEWSSYSSRLSQIFQETNPVSQVAILGPTLDIWSKSGLDRNPFNLEPWYLHSLWQALNHLGFGSDYVNARLLKSAKLEDGNIIIESMRYEVLLICDIVTMEAEVAKKIETLVNQGARIIMIGQQPKRSPNMIGALKNDGIVRQATNNALNTGMFVGPSPENKLKKTPELLMNWADQLMKNSGLFPVVEFSNPNPQIFQITHRKEDVDILFISNLDRNESYNSELSMGPNTKFATKWDPGSGAKTRFKLNENERIDIDLNPLESILIIADPLENLISRSAPKNIKDVAEFEVVGPWEVSLQHIENEKKTLQMETLESIHKIKGFQSFGGEIIYKNQFELRKSIYNSLTIDEIYETAEVFLNGQRLGLSWWGNNSFDIKGKTKKGKNKLEIRVTTLLANYVSSLKDNKTAQRWTSRYKDKKPIPCGLAGKVRLSSNRL